MALLRQRRPESARRLQLSRVFVTVRRQGRDARPSPGPGGVGEGREERPAGPQQPAGEQGDAAGGRTLPDVSRALRQAAAGQSEATC